MALGKPGYVWDGVEWVPIGTPVEGSEIGVTDHPALTGRTTPDGHPIEAITDLQPTLDGKSDVTHTHPGLNIDAGAGIDISGIDPSIITNIDPGSDAVDAHVANTDPHTGKYAVTDHLHDGEYSPDPHTHTEYDPVGSADSAVAGHVVEQDPHPNYLSPLDVIQGDGIAITDGGDGTITVVNTSKGGQPLTMAGLDAAGVQSIPGDGTWTPLTSLTVVTENYGGLVPEVPDGSMVVPTTGAYMVTASVGFASANFAGSQRAVRIKRGTTVLNGSTVRAIAPTDTVSNQVSADQYWLTQGDVITVEASQNSGSAIDTQAASTRFTMSLINGAVTQAVIGCAAVQTTPDNLTDGVFRGVKTETVILNSIGATVGTTMGGAGFTLTEDSPEGWYDLVVSIGVTGNANGNRRGQVLLNGDVLNAPLIPKSNTYPPGSGIAATIQVAGPIYLKQGDYVRPEVMQNSGSTLATSAAQCSMSLLFRGLDPSQEQAGAEATQLPSNWRPYPTPDQGLVTP